MIDEHYKKLNADIKYIEPSSEKGKLITEYIKNTHA